MDRENIYRGGQLLATEAGTPSAAAPSSLTTTTNSTGTNISLSWLSASGASKYRIERKSAGSGFALLTTTTSLSITDSSVSNGNAYLYKACSADTQNNCTSSYSNLTLGTAFSFTEPTIVSIADDPSGATVTTAKAIHITELRSTVNAVRSLAGLSSYSWTYSVASGSTIHVEDVRDLRTALDAALSTLNIQTSSYTDNTLVGYSENPLTATTIKAVHIRELRSRVLSGVGTTGSGGSGAGLVYVLSDVQGSARAVMNSNGSSSSIVSRHDYLPFGEEISSGLGLRTQAQGYNASDGNRWKYGLTERDATSGLDHTWWRKYESTAGRWTTPDPYNGSAAIADPQSFNRYAYVGNDPVNEIDPLGLSEHPPHLPPPPGPPVYVVTVRGSFNNPIPPSGGIFGDGGGFHDPLLSESEDGGVSGNPQRPPKQPERIREREKAPRDWYKDCVWREWNIFNHNVEEINQAIDDAYHMREILATIGEIFSGMGYGQPSEPGERPPKNPAEGVPNPGPAVALAKQKQEAIEQATKREADKRDKAIDKNCNPLKK